uniref:Uncharacterized protein n=1 Tax=Physcomitrium patens TaxID=3218 RepID=A0A2K1JLM9_PHYPA|nr:hypothetical protein PHYPA_017284 [Physcomitrium patens]
MSPHETSNFRNLYAENILSSRRGHTLTLKVGGRHLVS